GQTIYQYDPGLSAPANSRPGQLFNTPLAVNAVADTRFAVGTDRLYEWNTGTSQLDVTLLPGIPAGKYVTTMAYGGTPPAVAAPNVISVGTDAGLWVRRDTGAIAQNVVFPGNGSRVLAIAVDPGDWTRAFVTDGRRVFQTTDGGATAGNWKDLTGN